MSSTVGRCAEICDARGVVVAEVTGRGVIGVSVLDNVVGCSDLNEGADEVEPDNDPVELGAEAT